MKAFPRGKPDDFKEPVEKRKRADSSSHDFLGIKKSKTELEKLDEIDDENIAEFSFKLPLKV
jgi:hypothetical protein